ncbi:MAG TPA: class I SAM-dependent methyltransferase [Thermoanaerobaculia bacterium]|jgi:cyclopropane-fatty-acyl-phospholipid synthase
MSEKAIDAATRQLPDDIAPWLSRMLARGGALPCAFAVKTPRSRVVVGDGPPEFELQIHNDRGMRALRSVSELRIADAYVRGDLDIEGDIIKAMWLRDLLSDRNVWLKLWRRAQPLLFGRERLNPSWIAKHYDSKNIQILALDRDYYAYTPGIYLTDDDTLEESSRRKYEFAWESLQLQRGMELLEIGCGWGGMTRYCASRGVRVTAITLSRDQLAFTQKIIADHGYDAAAHYQDFFTFQPGRRFDAISCMGVIEDLSDYPRVMARFTELLAPGARAYLDFAAGKVPVATSSFITKHVWPGTFRMAYMPELMEAIDRSKMNLVGVYNDRHNYHLWARNGHTRWMEHRAEIIERAGEEIYRLFKLLFAGTSGVMNNPSHAVSAYRMVLELPADVRL